MAGIQVGGGYEEEEGGGGGGGGENLPSHLCESIDHRPLRGRCPAPTLNYNHDLPKQGTGTADHLTLLRLFGVYRHICARLPLAEFYFALFHYCPCLPLRNSVC